MPSDPTSRDMRAHQLRLLFGQMPIVVVVNLVNAAVFLAVLVPVLPLRSLIVWLAFLGATSAFRYGIWIAYRRAVWPGQARRLWGRLATIGSGASGLVWGAGGALLFPPSLTDQVFIGFVAGGMCAGAVAMHASYFPALLAFIAFATLPIAARFLMEGTAPDAALAIMIIVFGAALLLAGRDLNRALVETLRLKLDLGRHADELESANARLEQEIQQREAAQEALHQAEKLDALGQLTGGVAHDFNNLLTIILGTLEMARPHVADKRAHHLISTAHAGAERAAKLTQTLLSFSRRQNFSPELVNLNRVIEDFKDLLRHAIRENVTLEMVPNAALKPCRVDTAHFQTALINLVRNADDALPGAGGRITIETDNVTVSEEQAASAPFSTLAKPGPFVGVMIKDNGIGMSSELIGRAFEPFYTTKEAGKGSGLGLSQVYGFAAQSGGCVDITSAPGAGTSVRILLPSVDEVIA